MTTGGVGEWLWACRLPEAPAAELPGGYAVGDSVYYTGATWTSSVGHRFVFGAAGTVLGPAPGLGPTHVEVEFPENKGGVPCELTKLSREACPVPVVVVRRSPSPVGTSLVVARPLVARRRSSSLVARGRHRRGRALCQP